MTISVTVEKKLDRAVYSYLKKRDFNTCTIAIVISNSDLLNKLISQSNQRQISNCLEQKGNLAEYIDFGKQKATNAHATHCVNKI